MLAFSDHIDRIADSLRAAISQSAPSDDQIILGHMREALAVAETVRREMRAQRGRHTHVSARDGSGRCADCGRDFRHDIHLRADEV